MALKCGREHSKSKWLLLVSHLSTGYSGAWVGRCISFLNLFGGLTVYGAVPFSAGFVVCCHGNLRFKVHRSVSYLGKYSGSVRFLPILQNTLTKTASLKTEHFGLGNECIFDLVLSWIWW